MSSKDLYKDSGVDIVKGDKLVDWLKGSEKSAQKYQTGEILGGIGGFAGLFRPNFKGMKDPLLVGGTDGVGTKLLLALQQNKLTGVGIDLVAMCANDLYCIGARPLFFIDYYATGVLDENQFKEVLTGINTGLAQCETYLLGGETAELPGLYEKGHFDLAGFILGCVDGSRTIGPHLVEDGDSLISIASNGFHSNGYSLVRKWLDNSQPAAALIDKILTPTKIYGQLPQLLEDLGTEKVHAMANITGGGISGNLPRVIPDDVYAEIDLNQVPTPAWMKEFILSHTESLMDVEKVFNLGAGMIAVTRNDAAQEFIAAAKKLDYDCQVIGSIKKDGSKNGVHYL